MVPVSNLVAYLVKKLLSLLPPTWPFRIYNALLLVPFGKPLMSFAIRRLTPEYIDLPEGRILFDKDDPVMAGALSLGEYEPETMAIFRSCLKSGMTIVDIGANLGYFTVIAAGRVGSSGTVFAYEPDPHNFDLLERNITVNGFSNARAFPVALSDRAGTRQLFFGDNQTTHSFGDKRNTGRSESVVTDTLDNSLKTLGHPQIDLVKMDIEGAEPLALDGMRETIERNPTLIILFEFHPKAIQRLDRSPVEFLAKFKEVGFSLSAIDENSRTRAAVDDIASFVESFRDKELSKNLLAMRK